MNNQYKFLNFRENYETFYYHSYSYVFAEEKLIVEFDFGIDDAFVFRPKLEFLLPKNFVAVIDDYVLKNMIFNLGMIELISYWKTACPGKIVVKAHKLSSEQIAWWKNLYFNGLGEFFYLNEIKTTLQEFVEISSFGELLETRTVEFNVNRVMVPVGGGKDSVVSIELLKKSNYQVLPMMLNPNPARERTIKNARLKEANSIIVKRYLDDTMLKMNADGFLNGHTPFSALLAFTCLTAALLYQTKYIALSNEDSANESTVPGTKINHQYSKSFEFEKAFNKYFEKHIVSGVRYFSFLRPLNELQIASLFAKFPWHHLSFRSCNVGSKTDKWCGKCSKCLFAYIILSPFIPQNKLIEIFGSNLLEDKQLTNYFLELSGNTDNKPFECVGTIDEVNASLKYLSEHENFKLLKYFDKTKADKGLTALLSGYNEMNLLEGGFEILLKRALND